MNNLLAPSAAPAANAMLTKSPAAAQRPAPPSAANYIGGLGLSQADVIKHVRLADYAAKEFGALARNPDVTHKDVINSAGQAVADGQITPTQAVGMLSQVPQDPDKLKGWLDAQYAGHLTAAVHLKAAIMGAPQAPAAAPQVPMAPQAAPSPNGPPAPGNAPEPVTTGV